MNTDSFDPLDRIAAYFDSCDSLLNGFVHYVNSSKQRFTNAYYRIINTTDSTGLKWPLPLSYFSMTDWYDWENFMLSLIFVKEDDNNKSKKAFAFIDKDNDTLITLDGKQNSVCINCIYLLMLY